MYDNINVTDDYVKKTQNVLESNYKKTEIITKALNAFPMLTDIEKLYARVILGQGGVLYIKGEPGIAKSAILRSIAKKFNWDFIDLRLSLIDETDVGIFPYLNEYRYNDNGEVKVQKFLSYASPQWAINANKRPTLIGFEEINRCSLSVRNAVLGIFNEREVAGYPLNENVFMASTGNLGDDDGTEVEEMDMAIMNRLIPINHKLTHDDWLVGYANENIHPIIISFLKAYDWIYFNEGKISRDNTESDVTNNKKKNNKNNKYANEYPSISNPRSLDNFSKYLIINYGYTIDDVVTGYNSSENNQTSLNIISMCYIGANAGVAFNDYINNLSKISLQDILDNYDEYSIDINKYGREYRSDILNRISDYVNIPELKDNQLSNLNKFLSICDADERTGYLRNIYMNHVMGLKNIKTIDDINPNIIKMFKPYSDEFKMLFSILEKNSKMKNKKWYDNRGFQGSQGNQRI